MTECPGDKVACSFQEVIFSTICSNNTRNVTRHGGLFGNDTSYHSGFYLLGYRLHLATALCFLFLLGLLSFRRLGLLGFEWFFEVFRGFVSFAVVIDRNLSFIFLGYGFNLTLVLFLIRISFVKSWAVFLHVHTDIGIEFLAFLVYHILEVERATCIQGFTLFVGERESTEFARNTALF